MLQTWGATGEQVSNSSTSHDCQVTCNRRQISVNWLRLVEIQCWRKYTKTKQLDSKAKISNTKRAP